MSIIPEPHAQQSRGQLSSPSERFSSRAAERPDMTALRPIHNWYKNFRPQNWRRLFSSTIKPYFAQPTRSTTHTQHGRPIISAVPARGRSDIPPRPSPATPGNGQTDVRSGQRLPRRIRRRPSSSASSRHRILNNTLPGIPYHSVSYGDPKRRVSFALRHQLERGLRTSRLVTDIVPST